MHLVTGSQVGQVCAQNVLTINVMYVEGNKLGVNVSECGECRTNGSYGTGKMCSKKFHKVRGYSFPSKEYLQTGIHENVTSC